MISKFSILVGLLIARFVFFLGVNTDHQPLAMLDGWNLDEVKSEKSVFTLTDDSTMVDYEIVLLEDEHQIPVAYTSHILTPVCDDTLCALMNIQVYWNILGNYIGYDTIAGDPLTKNDHLPFETEDYDKMHRLLRDDNSIIKRKEKHELFDSEAKRVSEVVDAVTGATAKEVSEAVVDGALYSCYTLYHIVYGELSDSILSDMESRYSPAIQEHLLASAHSDYQLYVLKRLREDEFVGYQNRILELIHESIPLNRLYILKKMPETMWQDESVRRTISGYFGDLDGNTRTWFLRKMESLDKVDDSVIRDMAGHMESLSQNQLKILIRIFEQNALSAETLTVIHQVLDREKMIFGYLIEAFLEDLAKGSSVEN